MKYTTYYTLLSLLPALQRCEQIQSPIVGMEMVESGMHRDLLYTVQFDYPLAGKECDYILEQLLPAAVYVSVDQLEDLMRLNKLNAIYPKYVNIEVPTDKADPLTILIKGTPKITESIKLPIHFRYHTPRVNSTSALVDIPSPKMYITCPDSDDLQLPLSSKFCSETEASYIKMVSANANNQSECNWILIKVDFQFKSSLSARMPIGNTKVYTPILYATIILSWIVSLWIVFSTNVIPRRIKQKLSEQRILQNKVK